MAGIYLHVPFCRQACHYCDFHFSTSTQTADAMVDAIVREAEIRAAQTPAWTQLNMRTLYLGGGTPSLLSPDAIQSLLQGVSRALSLDLSALDEVTLEANPEDLTQDRLEAWLHAGVNRLSIGIQSFHNDTLDWMNRAHTGQDAEDGVRRAHAAGFDNMTVDLIYGVPTSRDWKDDVDRALSLPVSHMSAYALTVEPQTVLGTRVERGQQAEPSDSRAVEEYHHLCKAMTARGWSHYETSNWAAPRDHAFAWAQHNSAYWAGDPYLGLGPGAHGFLAPTRYANVSNNPRYLKAIQRGELDVTEEALSTVDRYNERIMTGLRTARGISLTELENDLGLRPDELEPQAWADALAQGDLVSTPDGRYRIPETRWITGDRVASTLFHVDAL